MPTRCALYARYSSDNQRDASIEDQFRIRTARAEREGWEVAGTFPDAAISGATTQRPGFQSLLEAMRSGKVDIVLAESLDRFSRDLEHVAVFYKLAQFSGVTIITLSEGEISPLHVGLKGTMGALYLKDLADKTRRGLAGRVRQGRSVGRVPYGYRAVRGCLGPDNEPERGLREIHPVEANVIRRIFRDYIAGLSPMAIARILNAEGVPGPNGGLWCEATIRGRARRGDGMLRAAIYVGRLVWNRRRTHKHPDTGRAHRRPNDPEDIVIQDVPEHRIVDAETWEVAQARLARDAAPMTSSGQARFWDTRRPHYLLTGKVVCGCCGALFTPVGKDYLACRARRIGGCQNATRVRRGPLEAQVLDALGSRLMARELVEAFVREFTREWSRLAAEEAGARSGQQSELAAVERKIANLVEALAEGLARGGAVAAKVAELERRANVLRAAVSAAPPKQPRLHPGLAEVYREKVARIRDAVAGDGSAEALEAARALIDKVVVSGAPDGGGPPSIELVGDLPEMLKAAGVQSLQPDSREGRAGHLRALTSSAQGGKGGQSPPDSRTALVNAPRRALLAAAIAALAAPVARAATGAQWFRTSDGVRLRYLEAGSGRVVVFVPGWCMPARIFEPQIMALSRRWRVVSLDPRGQGGSEVPAGGYDPTRRGQDIRDLLTHLGGGRVVLAGWSLGVLDALSYADMAGDGRLAGLVLIDNSVGEGAPPPPRSSNFFTNLRRRRDVTVQGFVRSMYRTPQDAAYLDGIAREAQRMPVEASIRLLSYPRPREFWKQSLYAVRRPVYYAVTPRLRSQAEAVAQNHPQPMVEVFEGAGHALFVDEPARFNASMEEFLSRRAAWG